MKNNIRSVKGKHTNRKHLLRRTNLDLTAIKDIVNWLKQIANPWTMRNADITLFKFHWYSQLFSLRQKAMLKMSITVVDTKLSVEYMMTYFFWFWWLIENPRYSICQWRSDEMNCVLQGFVLSSWLNSYSHIHQIRAINLWILICCTCCRDSERALITQSLFHMYKSKHYRYAGFWCCDFETYQSLIEI